MQERHIRYTELRKVPIGTFFYFDLYFNPTNTSESTISAIEYAASNAQYGEVMSAKYPMNIAAPE